MSTSNDVSPPSASAGGAPPPGFPLLSPPPIPGIEQLKQDLTASLDYLVAWTAIMIWDVISMFPSEFRLVWKSDWNYVKIVFLLKSATYLVANLPADFG
ncbi:DUF6533 domain-containing protein [Sporobolomyces koalae]|uniref:DUF6533 domain-containing protein n=1 Tax=Sporobolomyces koalae TaxID=500713 RepID=UPI003182184A